MKKKNNTFTLFLIFLKFFFTFSNGNIHLTTNLFLISYSENLNTMWPTTEKNYVFDNP